MRPDDIIENLEESIFEFNMRQKVEVISLILFGTNANYLTSTDFQELEDLLKSFENRLF